MSKNVNKDVIKANQTISIAIYNTITIVVIIIITLWIILDYISGAIWTVKDQDREFAQKVLEILKKHLREDEE